jgi:CBS domain-containing protein
MLVPRVHRLFVVDDGGVLVGVIAAADILPRLVQDVRGLSAVGARALAALISFQR